MNSYPKIVRLLQLALEVAGWETAEADFESGWLYGRPAGDNEWIRFSLNPATKGDSNCIFVADDSQDYEATESIRLHEVGKCRKSGRQGILRLGRDLLFPFLEDADDSSSQLAAYVEGLQRQFGKEARQEGSGEVAAPSVVQHLDVTPAGKAYSKSIEFKEVCTRTIEGERALLAFDESVDCASLFFDSFFLPHVAALREKGSANRRTRIPLFLPGADIRALGFDRTLIEMATLATQIPYREELVRLLLATGYFHLYVPDIGCLRTDYDLDPNTMHIGDILAASGERGSFTLGCERGLVFQERFLGHSQGGDEVMPLPKTLGVRFQRAKGLELYDAGYADQEGRPVFRTQIASLGAHFSELSERITQISENCISKSEADLVLRQIGYVDNQLAGASFPASEIERILRGLFRGDRLRPGSLRNAGAAVTNSGFLRRLTGGQLAFRSRPSANWVVASDLLQSLEALCYQSDFASLECSLSEPNLPRSAFRWAFAMARENFAVHLKEALPAFLLRHSFRAGGETGRAVVMENLLTLVFSLAEAMEESGVGSVRDTVRDLCTGYMKIHSLSLPQICFDGLDLSGWELIDCNLRNTTFLDCDLSGASMEDCLLSGALFSKCDFVPAKEQPGESFRGFTGCDISGASFEDCRGLESVFLDAPANPLARANCTASDISVSGDPARIFEAVRTKAATASGIRVASLDKTVQGEEIRAAVAPWPASVMESFAAAEWDEPAVAVRAKSGNATHLVRTSGFTKYLEDNYTGAASADNRPGEIRQVVSCDGAHTHGQIFLAMDCNGGLWRLDLSGGGQDWRRIEKFAAPCKIAVLHRVSGSALPGEEHHYVALSCAAISKDGTDSAAGLRIGVLDRSGRLQGSWALARTPWNGSIEEDAVETLVWIEPHRPGACEPELLAGLKKGGAYILHRTSAEGTWKATSFHDNLDSLHVNTFAYSPTSNVALLCAEGGVVRGYRNIEAGWMEPLFRFHTAHEFFSGASLLNRQGQFLIAGLVSREAPDTQGRREILWGLVQPFGNVVTIIGLLANSPGFPDFQKHIEIKAEQAEVADGNLLRLSSREESIRQSLDALEPRKDINEFSPHSMKTLQLAFDSVGKSVSSLDLPDSFEDSFGTRFRRVEVNLKTEGKLEVSESKTTEDFSYQRCFTESQLDSVVIDPKSLSIFLSPAFHSGARLAHAQVRISYPSTDREKDSAEKKLCFESEAAIQVNWLNNPYVATGELVEGDQFFGLKNELLQIVRVLQSGSHVLVRAARRSGKSSFLRQVARRLRHPEKGDLDQKRRIVIEISGERIIRHHEGNLFQAIKEGLRIVATFEPELRGDYLALADLPFDNAKPEAQWVSLADKAYNLGYVWPVILLVDEWGEIGPHSGREDVGGLLTNYSDYLKAWNVAFCLTSVPGDFPKPEGLHRSGQFRGLEASQSVDIGMLDKESLRELIRSPLDDRKIEVDDKVVEAVLRLSSGAPHDANILMYYALESARKEAAWEQGVRRIQLHHLLPGGRPGSGEWLGVLLNKYANRQEFLLRKLSETERQLVRSCAGEGVRPSMKHPDPSEWATAEWEKVNFGIPTYEEGGNALEQNQCRWRNVFADAGYRVRLRPGETTDQGITAAAGQELYALWIPWGLAEYIRTSVRNEGVER